MEWTRSPPFLHGESSSQSASLSLSHIAIFFFLFFSFSPLIKLLFFFSFITYASIYGVWARRECCVYTLCVDMAVPRKCHREIDPLSISDDRKENNPIQILLIFANFRRGGASVAAVPSYTIFSNSNISRIRLFLPSWQKLWDCKINRVWSAVASTKMRFLMNPDWVNKKGKTIHFQSTA